MRRAAANVVVPLIVVCLFAACSSAPASVESPTLLPAATATLAPTPTLTPAALPTATPTVSEIPPTPPPTPTLTPTAAISPTPTHSPSDAYASAYAESMERGDTEEWARVYATAYDFSIQRLYGEEGSRLYASAYAYAAAWLDYSDAQADGYAKIYVMASGWTAWGDVYAQVEAYSFGRGIGRTPDQRGDEEVYADAYAYAVKHGYSEADANAYASTYVEHNNCECVVAEWAHEYAAAYVRAYRLREADIDSEYAFMYMEGVMHGVVTSAALDDMGFAFGDIHVDAMLAAEERGYATPVAVAYADTYAEAVIWGMRSPGQAHDMAEAYAIAYSDELERTGNPALAAAYAQERGLGYLPEAKRAAARIYVDAYASALEEGTDWEEVSDDALFYANAYADAVGRGFSAERARDDANTYATARKAALNREKPGSWAIPYAEGYVRGVNWPEESGFERSVAFARAYAEGYADGYSGALARQE